MTVKRFLEQANFYPKLERWIFERNICAALGEAGFDVLRMKRVWDLKLMVVTAKSDISREARFEDGPVTRILFELHKRGLDAEEDHVDLSRQGRILTVIVGVKEAPRRERWKSGGGGCRLK